ncbi:MAG: radical SAM family heme chaperone HemW [Prolixibacteraceae bacterium]|jgi:oxygen-independent coproporphyrinogen-3 oxidase|nr:radical SAM family heme chaperone HemW [Prolixibacteraceae bacterium]
MAGIYFHIPFCKSRCTYCDFYKTTNIDKIQALVDAFKKELKLRNNYLNERTIRTIYFGGGTPSLLSAEQLSELLHECRKLYRVSDSAEITLEANPDDLDIKYLEQIKNAGINRLSIGIQTFSASGLKLMNRRHDKQQAEDAVKIAQNTGYNNISVDLIYGFPQMTNEQWQINLDKVFDLNVQHLSAYHLTYHPGTSLWNRLKKGTIREIDEQQSVEQFEILINKAEKNGFVQYEVSNFALPGFYSNHNSSYWKQTEYLGLGPSAHSFNIQNRQWNISNLDVYLASITGRKVSCETEILSVNDKFNDYIITSLRTIWGISLSYVETEFGLNYLEKMLKNAESYVNSGQVNIENDSLALTKKGIFISDKIMSDLVV